MIDYDFRDILTPLADYIKKVNNEEFKDQLTTVVIPEFIPEGRSSSILHGRTADRLKARLLEHHDIVIIDVPYHIDTAL
jgi:hypothetical protein